MENGERWLLDDFSWDLTELRFRGHSFDVDHWKRYVILFIPACLVFYVLSFGPALVLVRKSDLSKSKLDAIYRPFLTPGLLRRVIVPYARLWSPYGVPFASWKAPYTQKEVGAFLQPGIPQEMILQRFGQPFSSDRSGAFDGAGRPVDEILHYYFYTPNSGGTYGESVFGGFQASIKDGKLVGWSSIYVDGSSVME